MVLDRHRIRGLGSWEASDLCKKVFAAMLLCSIVKVEYRIELFSAEAFFQIRRLSIGRLVEVSW